MATKILIEDHFSCSPETLYTLLSDNDFDDKLMQSLKMEKELLDVQNKPGGDILRIRLTNPDTMPAIAKKFTGDRLSYIETRTWNKDNASNAWVIEPEIKGAAVEAKGTTSIIARDGGCIRKTEGSITVNLPLIGRKIEAMIQEGIVDTFKKNAEFCQKYIKENGLT
ncbi:MAG: DUF2505 domain-containing protein [Proteobacteria bacterium]|nr:DUF2505 domain-containing protein [Pseudomonadota bacterium]